MTRIRTLIVDDSAVIRRLLSNLLAEESEIEIVGCARDGVDALRKAATLAPDVIIMDVEMPTMTGLEALVELRKFDQETVVVMFSALTARGAEATLDALAAGADDYQTKPSRLSDLKELSPQIRSGLAAKIKALAQARRRPRRRTGFLPVTTTTATNEGKRKAETAKVGSRTQALQPVRSSPAEVVPLAMRCPSRVDVVVIGISTGGPAALGTLIPSIPSTFPVPIVIVQHMPPVFTTRLASRLDATSPLTVREADTTLRSIAAGEVWIAPGDYHIELRRQGASVGLVRHQGPKENFSRPAVDVLFRSAASVYGSHALALIMTGMGEDGLAGSKKIAEAGGQIITQNESTSIVWGMPGAVTRAGISEAILPLRELAAELDVRTILGRSLVAQRKGASSP